MYLSTEAKKVLAGLDVDPAQLEIPDPNDHTADVLGQIAEDVARHQIAMAEALRSLARELMNEAALPRSNRVNALGTSTLVRRHDEAFYALQALRTPLAAAVAAWKRANNQTTTQKS